MKIFEYFNQLQNGNVDTFIEECLNQLIFREIESNKFLIKNFEDSFSNHLSPNSENIAISVTTQSDQDNRNEGFFINNNNCFHNLIQYDLQPYDVDFNKVEIIINYEIFKNIILNII